jgi:hypothetical protein
MTLDGKLFYFTSAANIRQRLEVLLIRVTKTFELQEWKGICEKGGKKIKVRKG